MFDPILIAGFIALFVAVGGVFLALNLLVGRLVRPQLPNTEKLEVYECGEPTIGGPRFSVKQRNSLTRLLLVLQPTEQHLRQQQQVFIGSLVLRILKFHLSIPHHSNWLKLQQAVAKKHRGRQSLNGRLKKVDRCWQGQPLLICLCSM
mgnify:CR=1 FL=1